MAQPWEINDRVIGEGAATSFGANDATVNPPMPPNMGPVAPAPTGLERALLARKGIGEGIANFATSAIAGPVAKVAGTVMSGGDPMRQALGLPAQAPGIEQSVRNALTYEPSTEIGRKTAGVLSYPFDLYGRMAQGAGEKVASNTGSPMLGEMTQKAIEVAPYGIGRAPNSPTMFATRADLPLTERAARSIMQRTIKPDKKDLASGRADQAISTMLDEGIMPTRGGMEMLQEKILEADNKISAILANSTENIDVYRAAAAAKSALDRARNQVNPNVDVRTVLKSIDQFLNHPAVTHISQTAASNLPVPQGVLPGGGGQYAYMPVQDAQLLKRGTYSQLGSKAYHKEPGAPGHAASVDSQQQLARGLKDEIARVEPGVSEPNAALSRYLNVEEVASPKILMAGNRQPFGLGALALGLSEPYGVIPWMVERSPYLMGKAAQGLYGFSKMKPEAGGPLVVGPQVSQESAEEAAKQPQSGPGLGERALNALVPAAGAAESSQPRTWQVVSNLHGPVGTFNTRQEAYDYAKKMGIPTAGSGLRGGYFLRAVPIQGGQK